MTSKLLAKNIVWPLGNDIGKRDQREFLLGETQLARHMGVFGGSGTGKSKFLELLGRRMLDDYRGFCFIDPHGDTVEDLLGYAAKRAEDLKSDAVCKRIHYLEPTFETVFGFDPFEFRAPESISKGNQESAYHAWLHVKAKRIAEVVQRKQGQSGFEGMPLLERILQDVLMAVGTALTPDGRHLPLSNILVLLDQNHPRHRDVMQLVLPKIPPDIRGDFLSLAAMRTEDQRKRETQSTINRLRSLLSPIVKAIFSSATQNIDFKKIIMNRGIILVNLRKTDFFSEDQRNAIGGLLIHEILSTVESTARAERTPYYLIVDEARLFIGQDMMEALDQARKFKLSICLAGQHIGQFKTDEFDMTPSIINNCGNIICFQQKHPDDLKLWKEYFGYANLSFEKHFQIVDRPDGYDFVEIDDLSESISRSRNTSQGGSITESNGINHTRSMSIAHQHGVTRSQSRQTSVSESDSESNSDGENSGDSRTASPILIDGKVISHTDVDSKNRSANSSSQVSHGMSLSKSRGDSIARSGSITGSEGFGDGTSHTDSRGITWSEGEGESVSETINHKTVPLGRTREEFHETPNLKDSVEDQFHKFGHLMRTMPERHAMVSMIGKKESFVIKVADVEEVYPASVLPAKIAAMKKKLYATHPYYSSPDLSPAEQDRKLNEFLAAVQGERIQENAPEPLEGPDENSSFDE